MSDEHDIYPSFARLSPEDQKVYEEATRKGIFDLKPIEQEWRFLEPMFRQRGYLLRPRYSANWKPSWIGTNLNPFYCEDSIAPTLGNFLDARRVIDGQVVAIKRISGHANERKINEYLSSSHLRSDPANHCAPALDIIEVPNSNDRWYLVMPLLRHFNDPPFSFLGEIVDFVTQTLEGLEFMHRNKVAHRDCAALNIMMDPRPIFPKGYHPMRPDYTPDALNEVDPLYRIDHPVRYYFIDFGMSSYFLDDNPYVVGDMGRDRDIPELSRDIPYDAYKADVHILGNTFRKELLEGYQGTRFLTPLIMAMTDENPIRRATASQAQAQLRQICASLAPLSTGGQEGYRRQRVHKRSDESIQEMIGRHGLKLVRNGITSMNRVFSGR